MIKQDINVRNILKPFSFLKFDIKHFNTNNNSNSNTNSNTNNNTTSNTNTNTNTNTNNDSFTNLNDEKVKKALVDLRKH